LHPFETALFSTHQYSATFSRFWPVQLEQRLEHFGPKRLEIAT
jgi:hypothetical protein